MEIKTPKGQVIFIDQSTKELLKEIYQSEKDGIPIQGGDKTNSEMNILNNNLAVYCAKDGYIYPIAGYSPNL